MTIKSTGANEIKKVLDRWIRKLEDPTVLYQKVTEELSDIAQDSIDSQASATTGRSFASLSSYTQRVKGKGPKDALRGSNVTVTIVETSKKKAVLKSSLPYGGVHQYGNPQNTLYNSLAPIPARAFIPIKRDGSLSVRFKNKLNDLLGQWLSDEG